jgi:hypothetical protein
MGNRADKRARAAKHNTRFDGKVRDPGFISLQEQAAKIDGDPTFWPNFRQALAVGPHPEAGDPKNTGDMRGNVRISVQVDGISEEMSQRLADRACVWLDHPTEGVDDLARHVKAIAGFDAWVKACVGFQKPGSNDPVMEMPLFTNVVIGVRPGWFQYVLIRKVMS